MNKQEAEAALGGIYSRPAVALMREALRDRQRLIEALKPFATAAGDETSPAWVRSCCRVAGKLLRELGELEAPNA